MRKVAFTPGKMGTLSPSPKAVLSVAQNRKLSGSSESQHQGSSPCTGKQSPENEMCYIVLLILGSHF